MEAEQTLRIRDRRLPHTLSRSVVESSVRTGRSRAMLRNADARFVLKESGIPLNYLKFNLEAEKNGK